MTGGTRLRGFAFLFGVAFVAGCEGGGTVPSALSLTISSPRLRVGDTELLQVQGDDPDATLAFSTSDSTVAQVHEDGVVQAVGAGMATVVVAQPGVSASVDIEVWLVEEPWASPIAAGLNHTCAVTTTGDVYCWGSYGAAGGPTTEPTRVPLPEPVRAVTAGGEHTCALARSGNGYCWGDGSLGQLGNGAFGSSPEAVQISGGLRFIHLGAGGLHTCGVAEGGEAYCWGEGFQGQLGTGDNRSVGLPHRVLDGDLYRSVSGGLYHTCGVTDSGMAKCWGRGMFGALGNGTENDHWSPARVQTDERFTVVSVVHGTSCGITVARLGMCWGLNRDRIFGSPPSLVPASPDPAEGRWIAIRQFLNSSCFLSAQGGVRCRATGSGPPSPRVWTAIAAGEGHGCAIAVDRTAFCWGQGRSGELGHGSTVVESDAVEVLGGAIWATDGSGRH